VPSGADGVFVATAKRLETASLEMAIRRLDASARANDAPLCLDALAAIVPSFDRLESYADLPNVVCIEVANRPRR